MASRESLVQAMRLSDDTIRRINAEGVALADLDTMSRAIHDVYCGIMADHEHPNDKDRDQARSMIEALQRHAAAPAS
jgi:hypothetical protein